MRSAAACSAAGSMPPGVRLLVCGRRDAPRLRGAGSVVRGLLTAGMKAGMPTAASKEGRAVCRRRNCPPAGLQQCTVHPVDKLRFAHLDACFGAAQRPVPRQHLGERVAEKRRLALLRLERPPRRDNAGGEAHDACTSFAVRLWMLTEKSLVSCVHGCKSSGGSAVELWCRAFHLSSYVPMIAPSRPSNFLSDSHFLMCRIP